MNNLTININWLDGSVTTCRPVEEFLTFQDFANHLKTKPFDSISAVSGEILMVENKLMYEWVNCYFMAHYANFTSSDVEAFVHFTTYMSKHRLSTRTSLMKYFMNCYQGVWVSREAFAGHVAAKDQMSEYVNLKRFATEIFKNAYIVLGDGFVFSKVY